MDLKSYFDNTTGTGILSTANGKGIVDAAIYARPHIMADGTVAFIMRDRLSHENLGSNPHAVYLFIEEGPGRKGVRLYLTMTEEEKNAPAIETLKRSSRPYAQGEDRFLVFFSVDRQRPLVGDYDE
jgi:hypothetical protein